MNKTQHIYGAKYYFLVQERRQNVRLKNINLTYKFLCKTVSSQFKKWYL